MRPFSSTVNPNFRGVILGILLTTFSLGGLTLAHANPLQMAPATAQNASVKPLDYAALAAALEDPKSRAVLIAELQRLAAQSPNRAGAIPTQESEANQMAVNTAKIFSSVGASFTVFTQQISRLWHTPLKRIDTAKLLTNTWHLLVLVGVMFGLRGLIERAVIPVLTRLDRWSRAAAQRQHLLRAALSLLLVGGIGVAALVGLFVLGSAVAALLTASNQTELWPLTLFLNAFILLELIRLVLRLIWVPRYTGLRLFPITAPSAQFWMRRSSILIYGLGYGLLMVIPISRHVWGADVAQLMVWTLAVIGLIFSVQTVLQQQRVIRVAVLRIAERHPSGVVAWLLGVLAHTWHFLAVLYIGMVFLVGMTRPSDALPFIAKATGYTFLYVAAALLLSALITQLLGGEVRLKDHHRRRMPMLERRLNNYMPWLLRLIRFSILIVTLAGILATWRVTNAFHWLSTKAGAQFLSSIFDIVFVLGLALFTWLVIASLIEAKLNSERDHMPSARVQTLLTLFRNAIAIALITIATMMILSELGVNIGPLLAGAGVLGLAVGFGAQKLVQDVITGVFIQLENAINTGDTVKVGGITGTAEHLSIRSVGLRDLSGTYHIVPFSSVDVVSNYMRGWAFHKAEYGIAYRENIDDAIVHLRAAFDELMSDSTICGKILEPIAIPGVTNLGASSVDIRVQIKTLPGEQWVVGRAYNRLVKMHFDAAGIEIPFPHTTVYFGEDKTGNAPPLHVQNIGEAHSTRAIVSADDMNPE